MLRRVSTKPNADRINLLPNCVSCAWCRLLGFGFFPRHRLVPYYSLIATCKHWRFVWCIVLFSTCVVYHTTQKPTDTAEKPNFFLWILMVRSRINRNCDENYFSIMIDIHQIYDSFLVNNSRTFSIQCNLSWHSMQFYLTGRLKWKLRLLLERNMDFLLMKTVWNWQIESDFY